jgi:hypothetical protein
MRSRLSALVFSFWRINDSSDPRNGAMAKILVLRKGSAAAAIEGAANAACGAGISAAAILSAASCGVDVLVSAASETSASAMEVAGVGTPARWDCASESLAGVAAASLTE